MKAPHLRFLETVKRFSPLKPYFLQNRWAILCGLASLLLVDLLQLLIPLVIKQAVDLMATRTATSHLLLRQGLIILGMALLIAVFRYIWRYLIFGHSRKVEEGLRNRMYGHLQTLSLSFYQRTKTGDLMARAINDINAIRMATGMGLVALTDGLVLGMAAVGFMISISLKLALISLIPAPIIVLVTRILTRRMSAGFERVQGTFSDLTERVREAFAAIRVVKAYNRESWQYERIDKEGKQYIAENMHLARTLAFFFPMMAIFANVGLAIVIWLGGRLTIMGQITTGDFVAFTSYLNLLTWPMMAMGWVTNLIQRGSASMRRVNRILEQTPEIADAPHVLPVHRINGKMEIKGLNYAYPEQTHFALRDFHLQVNCGETVAVVGRVGSGKTTLLHVIPRLLHIPAGTVFIDDHDILQIPLKALRKGMGFVTQEAFVFSDTIGNNVVFGRQGVSSKALESALQAADIYEDIQGLDKGLDTMLGERGLTLSGGQRQRLTLARALVLDPPILILDDALSMVDTRTEQRILDQVLTLRQHKTNIIVSHRISTVSRADRIVVLEQGQLVAQGAHETLLEQQGIYATLYQKQLLAQELDMGVD